jgi:Ca2+-binding EF-hand superfamily protein
VTVAHTPDNPDCVFLQVLRQFRVNLSEEEFFHLTSFFDKNTTGKISYNDFLQGFLH